eukprot:1159757-Pelagomonas_calceolata.AAC.2
MGCACAHARGDAHLQGTTSTRAVQGQCKGHPGSPGYLRSESHRETFDLNCPAGSLLSKKSGQKHRVVGSSCLPFTEKPTVWRNAA